MWFGCCDHMGWMGLGGVVGLTVLVLLVWLVVRVTVSPNPQPGEDSPETILKRRYARGEMDREEFERRLSDLRK